MDVCSNNINFHGTHILKTSVLKKSEEALHQYHKMDADIVAMSFDSPSDAEALGSLKDLWKGAEFIEQIVSDKNIPTRKIYVLTSQNENFEKIEPEKILCVADFNLKGTNANLSFLQADSNVISKPDRTVKGLGKALVQGLCKYFKDNGMETMELFSRHTEKPFYRRILPGISDKPSTCESYTNMIFDMKNC